MSSIIIKNKLFFALCAAFISFCTLQTLIYPKGSLVLGFSSLRTFGGNFLFKYITHLGAGWSFIVVSILFLLFSKIRWGIVSLLVFSLSGLLSQFLKKIVFGAMPRPLKYFEGKETITTIEGVHNAYVYSFPSGHTTTAFAMFTLVVLLYGGNKTIAITCFILAVLTALSRIYLAQHFIEDILAGTFLGICSSLFLYFWLEVKPPAFFNTSVLNKPLLKLK